MKAQTIRLLDVILIGPLMIRAATRPGKMTRTDRALLMWTGIGTVLYNGRNFLNERQRQNESS